ncbi:MAG: hypothetical protein HY808_01085 [Nitrospirae bacterium]|nr:hypothetical protein [Nitrospirota bacterium]
MTKKGICFSPQFITTLLILSIITISVIAFYDILGYFFIGSGTLPLINNHQIHSFNDISRIINNPFRSGFIESGWLYYRPMSTLSFGIDYFVWKLNPFGYHLTDLALHTLTAVLVFFLARILTNGNVLTAWMSAIVFSIHPVAMETLPVIARRHNIMEALFLLISIIIFLKYTFSVLYKKLLLTLSLTFYLLALGSKESGILLLPIIFFSLLLLVQNTSSFKIKLNYIVKRMTPYLITTSVFIAWRSHILKEIGGNTRKQLNPDNVMSIGNSLLFITKDYFIKLFYPFDFLSLSTNAESLPFISIVLICILFVFIIYNYRKIRHCFIGTAENKVILFLLVWMLLPLSGCIYLGNSTSHRCMYSSIIPFSIILSILLFKSIFSLISASKEFRLSGSFKAISLFNNIFLSIITTGIAVSLIVFSPLMKKYGEWQAISNISQTFLYSLTNTLPGLPDDAIIHVYNFPYEVSTYRSKIPHSEEVSGLAGFSIKAWIDLLDPNNKIEVIKEGDIRLENEPKKITLDILKREGNNYDINIKYD